MDYSNSEQSLGKDIEFQAPPDRIESRKPEQPDPAEQQQPAQPENKETQWTDRPLDQLTVSDIDNLDSAGKDYISNILTYISFQRDPFVSLDNLEQSFQKAVAFIKEYDPKSTFAQIANADRAQLRASLRHCLPEGMPVSKDELEFGISQKEDLNKAIKALRDQTKEYTDKNNEQLNEQSLVTRASAFLKGAIGGSNPNSETRKILANQLALYDRLENAASISDADLSTSVIFEETDTNIYKTGPLSLAINTGRKIYVPSLTRYIEQRSDESKIPGRALLDRLIDSFKKITEGQVKVEVDSSIDTDLEHFATGTFRGAKSGDYKQYQTKTLGSLRVQNK